MRINQMSALYRSGLICVASATVLLAGCSMGKTDLTTTSPVSVAGTALQGSVHGGQQPVSGAAIQLYAASTAGYGATSYTLLAAGNATNATGNFSITNDYTCPSNSQVYLVATGGNSGGGNNPNLALMAALGPCGSLSPATIISMNEITTVASVWALAPFMSAYTAVGTSPNNSVGLNNAFLAVNKLVDTSVGSSPGPALPAQATAPVNTINTLADIIAACINSTGGTAGGTNACGMLFTAATPPGGTAPVDTLTAALNIAKYPSRNVTALLGLVSPSSPFQPTVASATDFTLSVKYKGAGLSTPSAAAVDVAGDIWITNSASNTVSELTPSGALAPGSPFSGSGLSGPSGIAIDAVSNAWITNKTGSSLTVFDLSGNGSQPAVTGLNSPTSIAIDGTGNLWVTNSGSNSVTAIATSGKTITSATNYTAAGINAPVAVAINPH